jgi:hypothetical protein
MVVDSDHTVEPLSPDKACVSSLSEINDREPFGSQCLLPTLGKTRWF